jgi:hypothetical protein
MKNLLLVFICLCLAIGCSKTEPDQSVASVGDKDPVSSDTIEYALALDSAVLYAKRYDSIAAHYFNGTVPIKAYTIRSADLLEVLGISAKTQVNYPAVRVYLGMDLNNHFRMFLTPVEGANLDSAKAGKDKILQGKYKHGLADVATGQYVLDFTSPCPATCPAKDDSPFHQ